MANENIDKLYQILDAFERAGKDKKEIEKARDLLDDGNLGKALEIIRKLNNSINSSDKDEKKERENKETKRGRPKKTEKQPVKRKRKKKKVVEPEEVEQDELEDDSENLENSEDFDEEETYEDEPYGYEDEYEQEDYEEESDYDNVEDDKVDEDDNYDEMEDDEGSEYEDYKSEFGIDDEEKPKYKEEVKKQESIYPEKLRNESLEKAYIGLLLNNPKLIAKYYILFAECYFDDQSLLNIYKSILFTEGGNYTPEIAKKGFNFSVDNNETYKQKQDIKDEILAIDYNPEKVYTEL